MAIVKGLVNVSGTPTSGVTLYLYRSDTGALIGTSVSATEGQVQDSTYSQIATEGGSYTVGVGDIVRYGANGSFFSKTYSVAGTYTCGTAEFGGDPAQNVAKTCQINNKDGVTLSVGQYQITYLGSYTGPAFLVAISPNSGANYQVFQLTIAP